MPISLTAEKTLERFGVQKEIKVLPKELTGQEEQNVKTVLEYMNLAYSPRENKGKQTVQHLCAPNNIFEAPSTFPSAHTAEEYAESHSKVLSSLTNLHIIHFDIITPKEDQVSLRYTATGSHEGEPHAGIEANHNRALWTAQGSFVLDEKTNLITHWWKDWDKMRMWSALRWVKPTNA